MKPYDHYRPGYPKTLDDRVACILEGIQKSVERGPGENPNAANIRHLEAFFDFFSKAFQKERFNTRIQPIPKALVRTTDRNFIVTVHGRRKDTLILVAHYDTWAGFSKEAPGADDNTSGEEVLKHYLLNDLVSENPPELTHIYLFSGSEECGTRGLVSQLGVTAALYLFGFGISSGSWLYPALALPFLPLLNYRFGVTGTRHFVDSLSDADKAAIRAAIAVDAVGEGRVFILENEMGANFIRALFPYEGSESLNDLLEEGAHLNHIRYNRFLAGGTTDSVAFLEERRFLPFGKRTRPIPAAAILTMAPGKCSPLVFGGKLHTGADTPDRVFPKPIGEVLTLIDYAVNILEGKARPKRPRRLEEHHYARLYRRGTELFLALKDAVEPNRRNINSILRVSGKIHRGEAAVRVEDSLGWGVETSLDKEMHDRIPEARAVPLDSLTVEEDGLSIVFHRPEILRRKLRSMFWGLIGTVERMMGRNTFLSMFIIAFLVAYLPSKLIDSAAWAFPPLMRLIARHWIFALSAVTLFQLLVLLRLFTRELPAAIDNAYKHLNRADNLGSLTRMV